MVLRNVREQCQSLKGSCERREHERESKQRESKQKRRAGSRSRSVRSRQRESEQWEQEQGAGSTSMRSGEHKERDVRVQ